METLRIIPYMCQYLKNGSADMTVRELGKKKAKVYDACLP